MGNVIVTILGLFGAAFVVIVIVPVLLLSLYDSVKLAYLRKKYIKARKRAIEKNIRERHLQIAGDKHYRTIQEIFNDGR